MRDALATGVSTDPLSSHQLLLFLLQLSGLLALAHLFGRAAVRLGAPAVVGELLVGVVLGPSLLGRLPARYSGLLPQHDPHQLVLLEAVGQVGVLLLVGISGAQLDLALIRRNAGTAARVSICGLVVPLALGVLAGLALPNALSAGGRGAFAMFIGVAMSVSAIPVISRILIDMRLEKRDVGRMILTAGLVDDAVGWALLGLVSALATTGIHTGTVVRGVGYLAAVFLVAATVGRRVVRLVLREAERTGQAVSVVTAATVLLLAAGAATQSLGLEATFGAFVCGILIGSSGPLAHEQLAPLRTFVLAVPAPVFFALAGLRTNVALLARPAVALAGLALLATAVAGKFAGAMLGARLSRLSRWEGFALGAGLNARGVVQIIVATVGVQLGVLDTAGYTVVVLVAITTSMMAPWLLRVAMPHLALTDEERARQAPERAAAPARA